MAEAGPSTGSDPKIEALSDLIFHDGPLPEQGRSIIFLMDDLLVCVSVDSGGITYTVDDAPASAEQVGVINEHLKNLLP